VNMVGKYWVDCIEESKIVQDTVSIDNVEGGKYGSRNGIRDNGCAYRM